jgi:hypothetical protein
MMLRLEPATGEISVDTATLRGFSAAADRITQPSMHECSFGVECGAPIILKRAHIYMYHPSILSVTGEEN